MKISSLILLISAGFSFSCLAAPSPTTVGFSLSGTAPAGGTLRVYTSMGGIVKHIDVGKVVNVKLVPQNVSAITFQFNRHGAPVCKWSGLYYPSGVIQIGGLMKKGKAVCFFVR